MPSPSRSRQAPRRRALFSHRRLLLAETVLVIGLLQIVLRDWIMVQAALPAAVRVLFGMALILGVFGGVILFVRQQVQRSLTTTHKVVQRLPLPIPLALVHTAAVGALFWCYARYWGLDAEVWSALWMSLQQAMASIAQA